MCRFSLLSLALLLPACADMNYQPPTLETITAAGTPATSTPAPRAEAPGPSRPPARRPAAPVAAPQQLPQQQPAMPPPVTAPPVETAVAPMRLTGITQREAIALLGAPASETDRPPAKVWRYRGRGCTLDLFFYLDLQRNDFFALHQAIEGAADQATQQACLQSMRRDLRAG